MTNDRRTNNVASFRLMERDVRLLTDLYLHRAISRDQFIKLGYFQSVPRCNSRMHQLVQAGMVRRLQPFGTGGSQALYTVGSGATALLAERLDISQSELAKQVSRPVAPLFLAHTLGLVDLRIAFQQQSDQVGVSIERWLPEPLCRHEYSVKDHPLGDWQKHVLKPDAYTRLTHRFYSGDYFIELDLGNVSQSQFARKIESYRRYDELGLFAEIYGAQRFDVLVVTTTGNRLKHLQALTKDGTHPRFLFTTHLQAQEGLFSQCWTGPNGDCSIVPGEPQ